MAEYDKERLFWIKLTDKFITGDVVDFLMSQKDGANYVVLYEMLCLKTVNNGGVLASNFGDLIVPFDVEKIQRDCKWFSVDTVRIALELYKQLDLVYETIDGVLAISYFDRFIGSQSYGAAKKALQRQNKELNLLQGGQLRGQKVDKCPPEKEKEKEKDREKDKELNNSSFFLPREEENIKKEYVALVEGKLSITEEEFMYLWRRLTYDELKKYAGIVYECEKSGKQFTKKTHAQAILDMAMQDRKAAPPVKRSNKRIKETPPGQNVSFTSYTPDEAMQRALIRSYSDPFTKTS